MDQPKQPSNAPSKGRASLPSSAPDKPRDGLLRGPRVPTKDLPAEMAPSQTGQGLGDLLMAFKARFRIDPSVPDDTPPPACTVCGGTGWVSRDVDVTDPAFGRAYPCACKRAEIRARELSTPQGQMRFETFTIRPGTEDAYTAATQFADGEGGARWLVILGAESGTGKSHLATSIAAQWVRRGLPVLWNNLPELWVRLRALVGDGLDSVRVEELAASSALVVLDDLGAGGDATRYTREMAMIILDARWRAGLPTVITSNHTTPAECAAHWDGRIASRVWDTGTGVVRQVFLACQSWRQA